MRCAYKNRNHIIRRSLVSFSGRIVPAIDDGWSFWAAIVLGQYNTADHSTVSVTRSHDSCCALPLSQPAQRYQ